MKKNVSELKSTSSRSEARKIYRYQVQGNRLLLIVQCKTSLQGREPVNLRCV